MRIAVIGTGNVGGALGTKWAAAGHDVVYGSRTKTGTGPGGAPTRPTSAALDDAEVVVIAIPGDAVTDFVAEYGSALGGRIVVDAVNRIGQPTLNSREEIAAAADVRYVRAFNTLGWENFERPPADADLFFAADTEARSTAEQLISDVGLRPAYVGDVSQTATVDGVLPLWFALVQQRGGDRRIAFSVVPT